MKNSTLIAITALTLGCATSQAQQARHYRIHTAAPTSANKNTLHKPLLAKRANEAEKVTYLPKSQTEYEYMDGEWVESSKYSMTYDNQGRIVKMDETYDGEITHTERVWTADGQLASETESVSDDDGETFTPTSKRVQTYDDVLPQFTLTKDKYDWDEDTGDWVANYDSFHRTVTRNADGNVTNLTIAVPYNGNYEDIQRITNTFDEKTKQATSFMLEELSYNGDWQHSQYLRNLKWKTTNGQLVDQYDSWQNYGNQLLSGNIADTDPETGEMVDFGTISMTYDDNGGYTETVDYTDVLSKSVTTLTIDDANGSYTYTNKYYDDSEGDNDGVLNDNDITSVTIKKAVYDEYGNVTLEEEYGLDEDSHETVLFGGTKYAMTYDPANGNAVKEMTISEYDSETGEYEPYLRYVTDEFTTVTTGIGNVATDNDTTTATYTIGGIKTNGNEGHGIVITKRGGKFVKIAK